MAWINKFVIYDTLGTKGITRKYYNIKASDYGRKMAQSHITGVKLKQPEVTQNTIDHTPTHQSLWKEPEHLQSQDTQNTVYLTLTHQSLDKRRRTLTATRHQEYNR